MIFTTIALFTGTTGALIGSKPSMLIQASDGNLYGTTVSSSATTHGSLFKCTTGGTASILVSNIGDNSAQGTLIQASDGNLYGTTTRTIFKCTTAGVFTVLWNNSNFSRTNYVFVNPCLVEGSDGFLYGMLTYDTTYAGNGPYTGYLFKIKKDGTSFTSLYDYASDVIHDRDGSIKGESSCMLLGVDDNIYGFYDNLSGTNNIFKIIPGGAVSVYSMNPVLDLTGGSIITQAQNKFYIGCKYTNFSGNDSMMRCNVDGTDATYLLIGNDYITSLFQANDGYLYFSQDGYFVTCTVNFTNSYDQLAQTPTGTSLPILGSMLQATDGNIYGLIYKDDAGGTLQYGSIFRLTNFSKNGRGVGGAAYTYESGINY